MQEFDIENFFSKMKQVTAVNEAVGQLHKNMQIGLLPILKKIKLLEGESNRDLVQSIIFDLTLELESNTTMVNRLIKNILQKLIVATNIQLPYIISGDGYLNQSEIAVEQTLENEHRVILPILASMDTAVYLGSSYKIIQIKSAAYCNRSDDESSRQVLMLGEDFIFDSVDYIEQDLIRINANSLVLFKAPNDCAPNSYIDYSFRPITFVKS